METDNNELFESEELDDELDFEVDLITLTDEEGEEHTFELVDTMEKDGVSYVALLTANDDSDDFLQDDGNLMIMSVLEEDGEEILSLIEDDDEFDEISEIFMERLSDRYEFDELEEE